MYPVHGGVDTDTLEPAALHALMRLVHIRQQINRIQMNLQEIVDEFNCCTMFANVCSLQYNCLK